MVFGGKAEYCGICDVEISGTIAQHRCSRCGMKLCTRCAKRKGGFFGIGGEEICPRCLK